MRSGQHAVVAGIEYAATIWKGKVSLFIPRVDKKPEGWDMGGGQTWGRVIDSTGVSETYQVRTQAKLDDVAVYVDSVNPTTRDAVVRAIDPPYSSINDQDRPPPHPLLEAVPEPPYSVDWKGTIPWDRLTDISETVGRIAPFTGVRIHDESAWWSMRLGHPATESTHDVRRSRPEVGYLHRMAGTRVLR